MSRHSFTVTLIHTCNMTFKSLMRLYDTAVGCLTHIYMWHDSFIRVTRLIHTCDMTHSFVWHDAFIRVTWFIHTCDMTHSYVWHDAFIRVTWLIHTCDMTHSYVWHDSLIRVTRLVHMCDMTPHSYGWLDVTNATSDTRCFTPIPQTTHTCDTTHSNLSHHSFIPVTCCIYMRHLTHVFVSYSVIHLCHVMSWTRCRTPCCMQHSRLCVYAISLYWTFTHDMTLCKIWLYATNDFLQHKVIRPVPS